MLCPESASGNNTYKSVLVSTSAWLLSPLGIPLTYSLPTIRGLKQASKTHRCIEKGFNGQDMATRLMERPASSVPDPTPQHRESSYQGGGKLGNDRLLAYRE